MSEGSEDHDDQSPNLLGGLKRKERPRIRVSTLVKELAPSHQLLGLVEWPRQRSPGFNSLFWWYSTGWWCLWREGGA